MDVEPPAKDCTDSRAKTNGTTPVKKLDLHSRLQPKQTDMDWEDVSWTRSVTKSGNDVRVTLNF